MKQAVVEGVADEVPHDVVGEGLAVETTFGEGGLEVVAPPLLGGADFSPCQMAGEVMSSRDGAPDSGNQRLTVIPLMSVSGSKPAGPSMRPTFRPLS